MKHINTAQDSREKLMTGINKVADIVKCTLGPCGSNVILRKPYNTPIIVNDGVSIAREIVLQDPTENAGAELLTSAASCTNAEVGDGTTTTCILTQALIGSGFESIEEGCNPILLREELKKATEDLVYPMLKDYAIDCTSLDQLKNVATISVGGNENYGSMIAEALSKVGAEGIVNLENNMYPETRLEMTEGYKIDKGYMTPYAINDTDKFRVDYKNCLVLCCYHRIIEPSDLEALFKWANQTRKPILLILEDMDETLFAALQVNLMKKAVNICPVKAPGFGFNVRDYMNDIAKLTGCFVYADDTRKLGTFTEDDFGVAARVTATRECTCIVRDTEDISEDLNEYVQSLRNQLEATEHPHLRDSLKERISKLTCGVATILVGATSETEQMELKLRIEDAINATRAALKGGVVAGGGCTLYNIAYRLNAVALNDTASKEKHHALSILCDALSMPEYQLIINSGDAPDKVLVDHKCYDGKFGYNARKREFCDLIEAGIIDPLLVVKSAIENAISIASTVLTTQATIISEDSGQ